MDTSITSRRLLNRLTIGGVEEQAKREAYLFPSPVLTGSGYEGVISARRQRAPLKYRSKVGNLTNAQTYYFSTATTAGTGSAPGGSADTTASNFFFLRRNQLS